MAGLHLCLVVRAKPISFLPEGLACCAAGPARLALHQYIWTFGNLARRRCNRSDVIDILSVGFNTGGENRGSVGFVWDQIVRFHDFILGGVEGREVFYFIVKDRLFGLQYR